MTTFSVLMPAYNTAGYIEAAIDSVLNQSETDLELVVIDDGSTDGTGEQVRAFSDPRLRYFYRRNQGVAASRNTGLQLAKGEFIAFLDADDLWHPRKLERHRQLLVREPQLGLSFNWFHVLYEGAGQPLLSPPWFTPPAKPVLGWRDFLVRNWTGTSSCVVLRAAALAEGLHFNEQLRTGEDYDLWLAIVRKGWQAGFVGEALTTYRKRADSLTVDDLRLALDHLQVVQAQAAQSEAADSDLVRLAVQRGWLDVAWSSWKSGVRTSWQALRQGYPALPHFALERVRRKLIEKT